MIKVKVQGGTDVEVKRCGSDAVVAAEVLVAVKALISPLNDEVKSQFVKMIPEIVR